MMFHKYKVIFLGLILVLGLIVPGFAQNPTGEGSPSQRLEVLRQKIDSMRRSLSGAISAFKDDDKEKKSKKDDKTAMETSAGRLKSLDKEASNLLSQVSDVRNKLDRAEKYQITD